MTISTLNKLLCTSLTVVLLTLSISQATEAWQFNPDTLLAMHVQEALENNPKLNSQRSGADASRTRISQDGAWPDPTISVGAMNLPVNTFDFNQEPMTGFWININQTIPLNGRTGIKSDIAEKQYEIASLNVKDLESQIVSDLSHRWYNWSYLIEAERTVEETEELLQALIQIALRRYETGQGSQADVLRLQTELAQLQDQSLMLEQQTKAQARHFAALMGREPSELPSPPAKLAMNYPVLDRQEVFATLKSGNPTLSETKTGFETSSLNLKLKKREWWPDLKLGVGYGFRQDADNGVERPDFFSVTAGISLPVFGTAKQGKAVQEAKALQQNAEYKLENTELQLTLQMEILFDEDQRLADQIDLYQNSIVPQAETTYDATLAAYSVGNATIDGLISSEKAVLKSKLDLSSRLRERWIVRTDIAVLSGIDFYPDQINLSTD